MKVLLSNDDGINAPGIKALEEMLSRLSFIKHLDVLAPDRDRSASSKSLTLDMPLNVLSLGPNRACVNGTPTDCVHLALTGILKELPDMIVSGINSGANLGDDVMYSGTVAAAVEGRFLGFPGIAFSLVHQPNKPAVHYETAAKVAELLLIRLNKNPLPRKVILNVNVPDVPYAELKGIKVTRLGERHRAESIYPTKDPRGRNMYWIGPAGEEHDAGPGTDFDAIRNNYASVTPLIIDLTNHDQLGLIADWMTKD
ncbi:MAG: 5'/3'-nucleotidase SurE [Pseudomonadota bacterium]